MVTIWFGLSQQNKVTPAPGAGIQACSLKT
jgi:hypothetical protein